MCYAFIYLLSNMDAWLRTGLNKEPSCIHRLVDPSDFFCSPFNSSHFTSFAPLLDAKSLTISSQMCSTRLGSMVFAWSEVKRKVPSAQIYFFLHIGSFSFRHGICSVFTILVFIWYSFNNLEHTVSRSLCFHVVQTSARLWILSCWPWTASSYSFSIMFCFCLLMYFPKIL